VTTPSAQTLLTTWEQGLRLPPVYRALLLLSSAYSETQEQLAQLSIGERNQRLLLLRQKLFGATAEAVVACPMCSESLEFTLPLSNFIGSNLTGEASNNAESSSFRSGSYAMNFRLLNSLDLLALSQLTDSREVLLGRCLSGVQRKGKSIGTKDLPENVIAELGKEMAKADPGAVTELKLECPACNHTWTSIFDIASFLWRELDHWAKHMLLAIHRLASAYGWREEDILKMSAWRRQVYLEMLS
jgi:hypothetical protein